MKTVHFEPSASRCYGRWRKQDPHLKWQLEREQGGRSKPSNILFLLLLLLPNPIV